MNVAALAGCKHKMFFRFSQMFFYFFWVVVSNSSSIKNSFVNLKTQRTYSLLRVQKYTVYWVTQALFEVIFWLFHKQLLSNVLQITFSLCFW